MRLIAINFCTALVKSKNLIQMYCISVTSDVTPILFQAQTSPQDSGSVIVKVHYTCTMALRVPLDTPFRDLQEKIAQKLGQPVTNIRLR